MNKTKREKATKKINLHPRTVPLKGTMTKKEKIKKGIFSKQDRNNRGDRLEGRRLRDRISKNKEKKVKGNNKPKKKTRTRS